MFNVKKIRPLFTGVVTTAMTYKQDQTTSKGGLLFDTSKMKGDLNNFQRVIAVGTMVRDVKEGDIVFLNLKRYAIPTQKPGAIENNLQKSTLQYTYQIPQVTLDGVNYLFLQNNDIEFVVEEADIPDGGLLE